MEQDSNQKTEAPIQKLSSSIRLVPEEERTERVVEEVEEVVVSLDTPISDLPPDMYLVKVDKHSYISPSAQADAFSKQLRRIALAYHEVGLTPYNISASFRGQVSNFEVLMHVVDYMSKGYTFRVYSGDGQTQDYSGEEGQEYIWEVTLEKSLLVTYFTRADREMYWSGPRDKFSSLNGDEQP